MILIIEFSAYAYILNFNMNIIAYHMLPVRNTLDAQLLWSASRVMVVVVAAEFFPQIFGFMTIALQVSFYAIVLSLNWGAQLSWSSRVKYRTASAYRTVVVAVFLNFYVFISFCMIFAFFAVFNVSMCVRVLFFLLIPNKKKLSDFNLDVFFFCAYVRDSLNI